MTLHPAARGACEFRLTPNLWQVNDRSSLYFRREYFKMLTNFTSLFVECYIWNEKRKKHKFYKNPWVILWQCWGKNQILHTPYWHMMANGKKETYTRSIVEYFEKERKTTTFVLHILIICRVLHGKCKGKQNQILHIPLWNNMAMRI